MMVVMAINVKRRESEKKMHIKIVVAYLDHHQNTCVIYIVGCHVALSSVSHLH